MKILKYILIGLAVVVGLVLIGSLFLPAKVHVVRTSVIKAQPDTLFNLVNELKNWNKWSAWARIDPAGTTWQYSDSTKGVGAWYTWASKNDKVGNGKLTILNSEPNKYIKNQMDFGDMGSSYSEVFFEPVPEGTKMTMTLDTDMGGNPMMKYMGLMMDKFVGSDYETCMKNIAELTEAKN